MIPPRCRRCIPSSFSLLETPSQMCPQVCHWGTLGAVTWTSQVNHHRNSCQQLKKKKSNNKTGKRNKHTPTIQYQIRNRINIPCISILKEINGRHTEVCQAALRSNQNMLNDLEVKSWSGTNPYLLTIPSELPFLVLEISYMDLCI